MYSVSKLANVWPVTTCGQLTIVLFYWFLSSWITKDCVMNRRWWQTYIGLWTLPCAGMSSWSHVWRVYKIEYMSWIMLKFIFIFFIARKDCYFSVKIFCLSRSCSWNFLLNNYKWLKSIRIDKEILIFFFHCCESIQNKRGLRRK